MKHQNAKTLINLLLLTALITASALGQTAPPAGEAATEIRKNAQGEIIVDMPFPKPVPINIVLQEFMDQSGIKITPEGKAGSLLVACFGENMTTQEVLGKLEGPYKLKAVQESPTNYLLMDQEAYNLYQGKLTVPKVFSPVHIAAKDFFDAIGGAKMLTKDVGSASVDLRTNQVIVQDLPDVLARVEELFTLMDVALFTRPFYIKYADMQMITDKLEPLKSETGTIEVDEKSHIIIVEDNLSNIQKMEFIIDALDKRQMRRVYNLNSLSVEESGLDGLDENLQRFLTKDTEDGSYFYIDEQRGLLFVDDTPEVHEEILKFLRLFDRTVDQVLIQMELLDVSQSFSLGYGTEFQYSRGQSTVAPPADTGDGTAAAVASVVNTSDLIRSVSSGAGGFNLSYAGQYASAQLHAALTDADTDVMLRPRLLIKSGVTAQLISGENNPIVNETYRSNYGYNNYNNNNNNNTNNNSYGGGYPSTSQQNVPSGLQIDITPKISPTGLVEIELTLENSDATKVELKTTTGNPVTAYELKKNNVETTFIIPDGETRAFSGLITRKNENSTTGVPILVKIPWIGPLLFGSKDTSSDARNIMIFITPIIVREEPRGSIIAATFDEENNLTEGWDVPKGDDGSWAAEYLENIDEGASFEEPYLNEPFDFPTSETLPFYDAPLPEGAVPSPLDKEADKSLSSLKMSGLLPGSANDEAAVRAIMEKGGGRMPNFEFSGPLLGAGVQNVSKSAEGRVGRGSAATTSSKPSSKTTTKTASKTTPSSSRRSSASSGRASSSSSRAAARPTPAPSGSRNSALNRARTSTTARPTPRPTPKVSRGITMPVPPPLPTRR